MVDESKLTTQELFSAILRALEEEISLLEDKVMQGVKESSHRITLMSKKLRILLGN